MPGRSSAESAVNRAEPFVEEGCVFSQKTFDPRKDAQVEAYSSLALADSPALKSLVAFLQERKPQPDQGPVELEAFEGKVHDLVADFECEILASQLASYDVDAHYVRVDGVRYRKAIRAEKTYVGQCGPLRVERNLYAPVGGGPTICPLELKSGVIEGTWTPRAARIMATMVTEVPPSDAARLIAEFGGMRPSSSSLDRLPKQLSERWEEHRLEWEAALRAEDEVPAEATTIVVSLDGVHVPLKKSEVKDDPSNKNGYREASCGTVSYLDKDGNRLTTTRCARMPETKKVTLKNQLEAEFNWALEKRPDLRIVKVADGASDNWEFLHQLANGEGVEILDFYHAATHLKEAAEAVHGAGTDHSNALFAQWRSILKEDPAGANKILRAVRYRRDDASGNAKKTLSAALRYFRSMEPGMQYHAFAAQGLPIGSGVVEAACKTVVNERLKQSGMRWTIRGGQAILTLRSQMQSDRWEGAWQLLAKSYKTKVCVARPPRTKRAA